MAFVKHPLPWWRVVASIAIAASVLLGVACSNQSSTAATARPSGDATSQQYRLTYVAVGASDAYGIGTHDPDRFGWPTRLSNRLGSGVHLINLGIPGATVAEAVTTELPIALDAHPDIVTVWLAVNDFADKVSLATYSQQLLTLLTALAHNTHARIFVGNIPNLTLLPYFANQDQVALLAQVQQWNASIAAVCAATGAHLVDLYNQWSQLAQHPEYISQEPHRLKPSGVREYADT